MSVLNNALNGMMLCGVSLGGSLFRDKVLEEQEQQFGLNNGHGCLIREVQNFACKLGISKEIQIRYSFNVSNLTAVGNASLPGRVGILINPSCISSLSSQERQFALAHELVHIQENHLLLLGMLPVVVAPMIAWGGSRLFPSLALPFSSKVISKVLPSLLSLITFVITGVTFMCFSRYLETRADQKAVVLCGTNKGALSLFSRVEAEGDESPLNVFSHPSSRARIEALSHR